MTINEFRSAMSILEGAYLRRLDSTELDAWWQLLASLDADLFQSAIRNSALHCAGFPTPAKILDEYRVAQQDRIAKERPDQDLDQKPLSKEEVTKILREIKRRFIQGNQ